MNNRTTQQHFPLRMENVSYSINEATLIRNLDLEINSDGTSIILGHNGAGKSLLLKLFHGVIKPNHGKVTWNSQHPNIYQYWRTFLLQRPTFFNQSIEYNIEFVLRIAGIDKNQHKKRCEQALEVCGLTHLRQRNTRSLSGGELQKVSLARAWVLEPSVILLDEPTVALDPPSVISFESIIQQFVNSGSKIIMTTHDLSQAERLANEIIFIDKGTLIEQSDALNFFAGPSSNQAQKFVSGELT